MNQTVLDVLSGMPTSTLTVDLAEWRPDEDPEGFTEACFGMVTFGCSVTVEGSVVTVEGPSPVILILQERIAATLLRVAGDGEDTE